ncbi:MAG: MoaD/ThiS family protein [Desulfuromonadales bacterium]|nr:MoaD/ThiS family protein [Desulfuromonadales bacterium]
MQVTVKLFASFRIDRFDREIREYPPATTVADVVRELKIPETEIGILLLNSVHVDLQRQLADNDVLAIFPLVGGG